MGSREPSFELDGNTLRVQGELDMELSARFDEQLRALVSLPHPTLVLDMSRVVFMSSSHVRFVAQAIIKAATQGRPFTVLGRQKTLDILRLAGLEGMATLQLAENG